MRAKYLMGKQPKTLITDGLPSYSKACKWAFDEAKHIRQIRLQGAIHNNKMERMNGEIRDREKTMRGLKRKERQSSLVINCSTTLFVSMKLSVGKLQRKPAE